MRTKTPRSHPRRVDQDSNHILPEPEAIRSVSATFIARRLRAAEKAIALPFDAAASYCIDLLIATLEAASDGTGLLSPKGGVQ